MQQHGMNPQDNREHNRATILTLIRNHGPISRTELARFSRLSKPVVTKIVDSLISVNLVFESYKAKSGVGRRPIMLELNQEHLRIIGVDLARTHVEIVVTDLAGGTLDRFRQPIDTESPGITVDQVVDALRKPLRWLRAKHELIGIGIGHPIPLSTSSHIAVGEVAPEGWYNIDLKSILSEEFGIPVFIGNDANVAALYEKWYGVASSFRDFIYIMIGRGVGAGIYCDGRLLLGQSGIAGEFGHILVNPKGKPCVCGKRGCLETEISIPALLSKMATGADAEFSETDTLLQRLANSNSDTRGLLREYAHTTGMHIGNLINIFNPEAVVIGGKIAELEQLLAEELERSIDKTVHPIMRGGHQLIFSAATENKVAKGASVLVQQHFFTYPHKYISDFERASS